LQVGDKLTQSYAARHLGFASAQRGSDDEARRLLTESVSLRQAIGFDAGVAAGQLALAEFERSQGCFRRATELLGQAEALAEKIGAVNVQRWIAQVRESW
jgi:hypothetical protein